MYTNCLLTFRLKDQHKPSLTTQAEPSTPTFSWLVIIKWNSSMISMINANRKGDKNLMSESKTDTNQHNTQSHHLIILRIKSLLYNVNHYNHVSNNKMENLGWSSISFRCNAYFDFKCITFLCTSLFMTMTQTCITTIPYLIWLWLQASSYHQWTKQNQLYYS